MFYINLFKIMYFKNIFITEILKFSNFIFYNNLYTFYDLREFVFCKIFEYLSYLIV